MSVSSSKAKKFASRLLKENRSGATWRDLSERYGVNHATLNRIAKSRGRWIPKDETILKKLELLTVRSPFAIMPRWWERTPEALRMFKYIQNQARIIGNETRAAQYAYKKKGRN
jgi:hypothetical protein